MAAITRTFKTFEIHAYTLDDSMPPQLTEVATIAIMDASMNDRKARTAFRDAGIPLPKNCTVKWVEAESKTYRMDLHDFLENAEIVNA